VRIRQLVAALLLVVLRTRRYGEAGCSRAQKDAVKRRGRCACITPVNCLGISGYAVSYVASSLATPRTYNGRDSGRLPCQQFHDLWTYEELVNQSLKGGSRSREHKPRWSFCQRRPFPWTPIYIARFSRASNPKIRGSQDVQSRNHSSLTPNTIKPSLSLTRLFTLPPWWHAKPS